MPNTKPLLQRASTSKPLGSSFFYKKCDLTENERRTKTKNVTKIDIARSGGVLLPVRPNIGTTKSKCIQNIYDHKRFGIARDSRCIMTNALQLPGLAVERAFPRHISQIKTRPNRENATTNMKRYAEPKL